MADLPKFVVCSTSGVKTVTGSTYGNRDVAQLTAEQMFDIFKTTKKCFRATSNDIVSKLLLAIESFGEEGCNSEEANKKAWPNLKYECEMNPFMRLGLFVEPANENAEANRKEFPFLSVVSHKYNWKTGKIETMPVEYWIGNLSRNSKMKWRISKVGKQFLDNYVRVNEPFAIIAHKMEIIQINLKNGISVPETIIQEAIRLNWIDPKDMLNDIDKCLADSVLKSRFGSKLKSYKKFLKNYNKNSSMSK